MDGSTAARGDGTYSIKCSKGQCRDNTQLLVARQQIILTTGCQINDHFTTRGHSGLSNTALQLTCSRFGKK